VDDVVGYCKRITATTPFFTTKRFALLGEQDTNKSIEKIDEAFISDGLTKPDPEVKELRNEHSKMEEESERTPNKLPETGSAGSGRA